MGMGFMARVCPFIHGVPTGTVPFIHGAIPAGTVPFIHGVNPAGTDSFFHGIIPTGIAPAWSSSKVTGPTTKPAPVWVPLPTFLWKRWRLKFEPPQRQLNFPLSSSVQDHSQEKEEKWGFGPDLELEQHFLFAFSLKIPNLNK